MTLVEYRDWRFEVDLKTTVETYSKVPAGGAETCICEDCKNYIAVRDKVFPAEIKDLFRQLGIDFHKEVEITTWAELPGNLRRIGGWFHFKGRILAGKTYRVNISESSFSFDLTPITTNFSIGFDKDNALSYFGSEEELVQVEFDATIPWVLTG